MSPYRVLVATSDSDTKVLSSMLSGSDRWQRIFIIEKFDSNVKGQISFEGLETKMSNEEIAHKMSTRRNSTILGSYVLYESDDGRTYQISSVSPEEYDLNKRHYTQSDCLRAAMVDFCKNKNWDIVQQL